MTESEEGVGRGRCAAAGCGRFVRAGEERCRVHGGSAPLAPPRGHPARGETTRAATAEGEEGRERKRRAAAAFRRRLEDGEYRGLFGRRLGEVLAQAATDRGLGDEIGALRVTLARLLVEEQDPEKLAASVARVAGVAVQAARAQRAISGELADGLTEALTQILTELDG